MSKNISKSVIFAVMLMGLFLATSVIARADDVVVPDFTPSTQGSNDAGDTTIVPNTGSSNTAGDPTIIPNTGGSNTSGDPVIIPNGQGSNTAEPTVAVTPVDNGGGNGSGGGGVTLNTSGGGFALVSSNASSTANFIAGRACDYLSDYLKLGRDNNTAEVTKLQIFLKNNEKIDVDITGIFDNKTFEGVKAFQEKYLVDVMGPWGVTTPTGQVWYTTKKKVNELYCKSIVNLTPAQLAEIEAYRNGAIASTTVGTTNPDGSVSTSTEVGVNNNTPLTAATVNLPFTTKIWNFVKWLFGY